jgi:hypothetical protein
MNAMTQSDISKIGGSILSGFKAFEIKLIQDPALRLEVVRSIGQVPMAELMPISHQDRLQNFTGIVLEGRTSLSLEDLTRLGTLSFFMPPESWNLASSATIKTFLETSLKLPHHKCVCLPRNLAASLSNAMVKAYG